jgi:hypothetical protein
MKYDEALQHGLGYAEGHDDASSVKTSQPGDAPGQPVEVETAPGVFESLQPVTS